MLKRFFSGRKRGGEVAAAGQALATFKAKYAAFQALLAANAELLQIVAEIEEKLRGDAPFGLAHIQMQAQRVLRHAREMVRHFEGLSGRAMGDLKALVDRIEGDLEGLLHAAGAGGAATPASEAVLPYSRIGREMVDAVGGKNANLGEIHSRARLPVPRGFAITTRAFQDFLEANDLREPIRAASRGLDPADLEASLAASREITGRFAAARLPDALSGAILGGFDAVAAEAGLEPQRLRVALRSSAVGEDSALSFAGQYLSLLNVPRETLLRDYQRVLASLFSAKAIAYRLNQGITLENATMSVACLEMIPALASGVAYTRHPFNILDDHVIINAVWGLGLYAVDGVVTPDSYSFSKESQPAMLGCRVHDKPVRLVSGAAGELVEEAVPWELRKRPCLREEQSRELARHAMRLEAHFGCPQDIEWALTPDGRLVILQARPLRLEGTSCLQGREALLELGAGQPLIASGEVASPGVGCGPAWRVSGEEDLLRFPEGGVLVAAHPSPRFVVVMPRARAIVTDTGSVTGHMASLAREFNVPTVLNTEHATRRIADGDLLTVDAFSGRIYAGRVEALLNLRLERGAFMKNSPMFHLLRRAADLIVPLNLVDPRSTRFSPGNCRTIHDIMRLLHEWSYGEIFQLGDLAAGGGGMARRLEAGLHLDLYVIDLGGGVAEDGAAGRSLAPDRILSTPLRALLRGLSAGVPRGDQPRPVDLGGFLAVMGRQMLEPPNLAVERFGDKSYAIVSDRYLNFSSRVGYHYGVLDAYCGRTVTKNYVNFEFKGGAADDLRRNRRARAIALILERAAFEVQVTGDRVRARYAKREAVRIEAVLEMLGRLLQFTRQMDMLMQSEAAVIHAADAFQQGAAGFHQATGATHSAAG
jgi:pyruvate,water dikinase